MATTKELKNRIKSIKDTKKITNAMYLISSTKMRKAKAEMEGTRPYFDALRKEIRRMFRTSEGITGKYLIDRELANKDDECYGILVITADKGLAGAYNMNVIKDALELIGRTKNHKLYVVGEYGRQYFMSRGYNIEEDFEYTAQNPTLYSARKITNTLLEAFDKGQIDRCYISYTDFKNSFAGGVATHMRLLPLNKSHIEERDMSHDNDPDVSANKEAASFTYEPNLETVLNSTVSSYLSGFVYAALVNSYCSEQNARIAAMSAANDNADELLGKLSLEYNHVRQGAITQEITEISSGARAQKISAEQRSAKKKKLIEEDIK